MVVHSTDLFWRTFHDLALPTDAAATARPAKSKNKRHPLKQGGGHFRYSLEIAGRTGAGISSADLAANGSRIFMKMAFELGVFHGDPHPGNIRIMPDGAIALIDYGMIGVLDDEIRELLVDLFTSVARQDVKTATNVMRRIGQPFRPKSW